MKDKTERQLANTAASILKRKKGISPTTRTYDCLSDAMLNLSANIVLVEEECLVAMSLFEQNLWFCLTTRRMIWSDGQTHQIYLNEISKLMQEVLFFPPDEYKDNPRWEHVGNSKPMSEEDLLPSELVGMDMGKVPLHQLRVVLSDGSLCRIPLNFGTSFMGIHSAIEYLNYR